MEAPRWLGDLNRRLSYPGREGWTAMKTTRKRYTGAFKAKVGTGERMFENAR
jgi:hypothetical protein